PMRRGPAHTHGPREQAHGMRSLKTLIPFEDARRMALDLVRPIDRTEIVRLLEASGRVAAEDVRSRIDVPLADRAGMDGYAVVARDTAHATKSRPVVLRRLEVLHADTISRKRVAGSCTEVATGSTLPPGANSETDPSGPSVRYQFEYDRESRPSERRGAGPPRSSVRSPSDLACRAPTWPRERFRRVLRRLVRRRAGHRRRRGEVPG